MKKILIVDDDVLVCRFLSQLVDWEGNGYELVGIARDGSQALTLIEEKHPHILITDIEMPVMNGIDLVKQIRKTEHEMKILILSCHDDFAHVKEGMRAGADEYFLKDELTGKKLLELLETFSGELSSRREESAEEVAAKKIEAEEKYLLQLLEGTAVDVAGRFADAILAVHVTEYEERASLRTMEERESFYRAFTSMLRKQISDQLKGRVCHVRGGWFALLVSFTRELGWQEQQYLLLELTNKIQHQADKHFELKVGIGIVGIWDYGNDIAEAWERARGLLGYAFYERKQVFVSWQYPPMGRELPEAAEYFLEKAAEWNAKRDPEKIREGVKAALESFEKEKTREAVVAGWLRNADGIFQIKMRSLPKKIEGLQNLGKEYTEACKHHEADLYSDSIAEVIRYIQENYRNNITLNAAANAVHLTPTYLSYMFHKETNVTFSDYLQNCRMEHAKELLIDTGEKVREISEMVGYNDYRHFCKSFKKQVGVTPQEYRKRRK